MSFTLMKLISQSIERDVDVLDEGSLMPMLRVRHEGAEYIIFALPASHPGSRLNDVLNERSQALK